MDRPWLSVITPTLDDRAGLAATRASLAHQTMPPGEWLVQDGGSTDGTLADLGRWAAAKAPAPRPDWQSAPDGGPFAAMNAGWQRCRGAWLVVLNAGDRLADDRVLADLAAALPTDPHGPVVVYGASYVPGTAGAWQPKPARPLAALRWGMIAEHQAILMRTDALAALGQPPFDPAFRVAADYALVADLVGPNGLFPGRARRLLRPISRQRARGISARLARLGRQEQARIQHERIGIGPGQVLLARCAKAVAWHVAGRAPSVWPALRRRLGP